MQGGVDLSFMEFEHTGSAQTYNASSFIPDSASTATALSTGHITWSQALGLDVDYETELETIAEKLKKQKDYKIGVVTSVNVNHATPAGFYAHQNSRTNYYDIGLDMIASSFDYFAGGEVLDPTASNTKTSIYDLAIEAGYKVVNTKEDTINLKKEDGKAIVIGENIADSGSIDYDMDRKNTDLALADYVSKGIEMIDNDNGFFMMVESGKVDWACHANDAKAAISEVIALSNAVDKAIEFYNEHPNDTLIVVTADHETGGLTLGNATTKYDTFFNNLSNQKLSAAKFDSAYVSKYKKEKTSLDIVLDDIQELFGLVAPINQSKMKASNILLTDYEYEKLEEAYKQTLGISDTIMSEQERYELYGTYNPITVTITHLLNNKSGISFTTYSHSGLAVPVFAKGLNTEVFDGYYYNTDICKKLLSILKLA